MSGGWLNSPTTVARRGSAAAGRARQSRARGPGPTPIAVGAGSVGWVGTSTNGQLAYNVTSVDEVCPVERKPDCAEVVRRPLAPGRADHPPEVDLAVAGPQPGRRRRDRRIRERRGRRDRAADRRADRDARAPTPSTDADADRAASTDTDARRRPRAPSRRRAPSPSSEPPASEPTASRPRSRRPARRPSRRPSADARSRPASPTATPAPTLAANLAIVSGVKVVGQSASYSPDGDWFAFTARPSDGSTGPDIYVWRVGDELARRSPTTTPASSGRGPAAGSSAAARRRDGSGRRRARPRSSSIRRPARRQRSRRRSGGRSSIPRTDWAVVWDGTVRVDPTTRIPVPDKGSLVLRGYSKADGVALERGDRRDRRWRRVRLRRPLGRDRHVARGLGGRRERPVDRAAEPRPHRPGLRERRAAARRAAGRDRAAGLLDRQRAAGLGDAAGQGGEGSRVQIVAWTDESVGAVESGPITRRGGHPLAGADAGCDSAARRPRRRRRPSTGASAPQAA